MISFAFCIWPDFARLALNGTPGLRVPADRGVLASQSNSLFALSHCLSSLALWQCSLPRSSCCSAGGCQQQLPAVLRVRGWGPSCVASLISPGSHNRGSHPRAPSHGLSAWKLLRALVSPDDSSCWWKLLR